MTSLNLPESGRFPLEWLKTMDPEVANNYRISLSAAQWVFIPALNLYLSPREIERSRVASEKVSRFRFQLIRTRNGRWRFRILGRNNRIIVWSEEYKRRKAAELMMTALVSSKYAGIIPIYQAGAGGKVNTRKVIGHVSLLCPPTGPVIPAAEPRGAGRGAGARRSRPVLLPPGDRDSLREVQDRRRERPGDL
jgi:uncharacterized protein YegP (UPF0339 family)